jgi:hypothetical protein
MALTLKHLAIRAYGPVFSNLDRARRRCPTCVKLDVIMMAKLCATLFFNTSSHKQKAQGLRLRTDVKFESWRSEGSSGIKRASPRETMAESSLAKSAIRTEVQITKMAAPRAFVCAALLLVSSGADGARASRRQVESAAAIPITEVSATVLSQCVASMSRGVCPQT